VIAARRWRLKPPLQAKTCLFFLTLTCNAAWLRLQSPNFELYTDAGEPQGREVLRRIEDIRQVFSEAVGAKPLPLPVRVFLYSSERDYKRVRPTEQALGFYQAGAERDYIGMLSMGQETLRAVYHEYVHLVLQHSSGPLPKWLEEGTAEFYSTMQRKGERVLIGMPVLNHVRMLGVSAWLDPAGLQHGENEKAGVFYPQSWALVHMLNMEPRYRKNLPRFAELLEQATPAQLAFEDAFGKPLGAALVDLRLYVRTRHFRVADVYGGRGEELAIEVSPVTKEEAGLAQVELMIQMGRGEASRLLRELNPQSPEVQTALGMHALGEKRIEDAKRHLLRAIELGSRQALPYFEYAMLTRETGGDKRAVRRYLTEAVGRNPKLAEAQFLLGLMAQEDGRHREAIGPLEEAVKGLPRQSYFWHALAVSYHQLGEGDRARRAARKAADSARSEQERSMAQGALRMVTQSQPQAVSPKAPTAVPESWKMRRGDGRIEGTLEHIDCLGEAARFHVRVDGKPVALWVSKPGEVLLKSVSGITFEFVCGAQRPRRVLLEYVPGPDSGRKVAGEITAIEFRQ